MSDYILVIGNAQNETIANMKIDGTLIPEHAKLQATIIAIGMLDAFACAISKNGEWIVPKWKIRKPNKLVEESDLLKESS